MPDDPAIARVREVRHRISHQHAHDPKKLVEYYMQLQAKYQDRLLEQVKHTKSEEAPAQA
jgi:hypothetical protein